MGEHLKGSDQKGILLRVWKQRNYGKQMEDYSGIWEKTKGDFPKHSSGGIE